MENGPFEIYRMPAFETPSMIVSWKTTDPGEVGSLVTNFLIEKLEGQEVAEIKPLGFFPFGGVRFKDDLIQIPESKFWICKKPPLLIFRSDEPTFEHYVFLKLIMEFAQSYCHVREFYTVSGAISAITHTHSRRLLTVFNQIEFKARVREDDLIGMSWEGPPAISSYLLWVARRRELPGLSIWVEIPFYLAPLRDAEAASRVLSFFNRRFSLSLNLERFEVEAMVQRDKLAQLRKEDTETDQFMNRLERGESLGEEEQIKLTRSVYEALGKES